MLVIALMSMQCKKQPGSSTEKLVSDQSTLQPDIAPSSLNPDDCLVLAEVLSTHDKTSLLLIKEVKEVGFGFKRNVKAGDTIMVSSVLDSSDSTFLLSLINRPGGGTYSAKKFSIN